MCLENIHYFKSKKPFLRIMCCVVTIFLKMIRNAKNTMVCYKCTYLLFPDQNIFIVHQLKNGNITILIHLTTQMGKVFLNGLHSKNVN